MNNKVDINFILNSTHDGIIAVNNKGIINLYNAAAERAIGIHAENVLGHPASKVIPGTRLHIVLRTGVPELNQQQNIGNKRLLTNRMPVHDSQNNVIGAVAVFRDITEIQHLTEEITGIQEMKLFLEAIIDSTQDVISVSNAEGNLILVNQAYTRLIGLSKNEVIGKPATIDISTGDSMHLQVMKTLEPVCGVPLQVGPQSREVIVNAAPVLVQGELKGSVIVAHDVSEIRRLTEELQLMKSLVRKIQSRYTFDDIIAIGPSMLHCVELAKKAACTPATVLLNGESGTGKELFAHAIHHASQRKSAPFIRVSCAAIPESLLESELFGYEEGAFTGARKGGKKGLFEEANNGSIFLDEIGEISLPVQVKLLRVLQEKEIMRVGSSRTIPINIRTIAATNRNLVQDVAKGFFREDLYYRLNVFPISIPPLRERLNELPYLIRHLLKKLNIDYGRNVQNLSDDALTALSSYHWPGNVRELENVLARGMISMFFNETVMQASHLPSLNRQSAMPAAFSSHPDSNNSVQSLAAAVEHAERQAIAAALQATQNNKAAAARNLGISIRNLYYKIEKYQL